MANRISWSAEVNMFFFSMLSIFGAHCFYKSTRKRVLTILTWATIFFFCFLFMDFVYVVMPTLYQERARMYLGYSGLLAYLYLFRDIPASQSIFTYFFVDCIMYLSMLLARILAVMATALFAIDADIAFFISGTATMIVLAFVFQKVGQIVVEKALPTFSKNFSGLTIFSATMYTTVLLFVDVWATWPLGNPLIYIKLIMLSVSVVAGYYMAFNTLHIASQYKEEENRSNQLLQQLGMNEKYYDTLLGSMSQTRMYNHDLKHHVNTIDILSKEGNYEILSQYITSMADNMPCELPTIYCEDLPLNALLNYMDQLFRKKKIPFTCAVHLPKKGHIDSMHLCIIFGNALENAMEASEKLSHTAFVTCTTDYEDNAVVITITNRFDGKVQKGSGYVSSKKEEGHGLGLNSICTVVERYRGWMGIETSDDLFTLKIMLYSNECSAVSTVVSEKIEYST